MCRAGKHWSILRQCHEQSAVADGALEVAESADGDVAVEYDPKGHYLQVCPPSRLSLPPPLPLSTHRQVSIGRDTSCLMPVPAACRSAAFRLHGC